MLIEIEPEALTRVCDAALRSAGVTALADVTKLMMALSTAKSKFDLDQKKGTRNDGNPISPNDSELAK